MTTEKKMNIKKSVNDLESYFREAGNSPETINHYVKEAALTIATVCAHPADMTAEDLEKIALPLNYLSEIIDIIDKYEEETQTE